jgi:hypothetical protein
MKLGIVGLLALSLATTPAFGRGGGHGGHSGSHSSSSSGEHRVSGYVTSRGTYVAPHYATNPNGTRNDNYSTRGNVNPHTGEPGTKPRDEDAPN